MLLKNTANRPIREYHVRFLSEEMISGRWVCNGDPIRFSDDVLIDGQHRLMAIVKSGMSIMLNIVTDLPNIAYSYIDNGGIKRTAADLFARDGQVNSTNLAATLPVIDNYYNNRQVNAGNCYSITDVYNLLTKYPDAPRSVSMVNHAKKLAPPRIVSACHYIFSQIDTNAADDFLSGFLNGAGLSQDSPILKLREKLRTSSVSYQKMTPVSQMDLIIQTWNVLRKRMKSSSVTIKSIVTDDSGRLKAI